MIEHMSTADELVAAIRERIAAGVQKEQIKSETLAAGHKTEIFEAAYTLATSNEFEDDAIPASKELFLSGIRFVRREWKFALLVGLPLAILSVTEFVTEYFEENTQVLVSAAVVGILSLLVYALLILVALKVVTQEETAQYTEAKQWAKKNILPALGIYLLMMLVVWGGFVLFIIPGIIVSLALYFALFALVNEGVKGESALQYSRKLVSGRWWLVARKVVGISLYNLLLILVLIITGAAVEGIISSASEQLWSAAVFTVISQFAGAAISLSTLYAGNQLYQALNKRKVTEVSSNTPYRLLAVLGLVSIIALGSLVTYLVLSGEERDMFTAVNSSDNLRSELIGVGITAGAYKFTNDDSYMGVCEILTKSMQSNTEVSCNDTPDAWAVTVTRGGVTRCTDSTGYNKLLEVGLEDRTVCLPL